jgi:type IV pilus assembly protein PilC
VRKKILLSLLYPAILIVLVALLVVFLVTFVVPRFAELYETTNAELPVLTRWLIAVGDQRAGATIVIAGPGAGGGVVGGRLYLRTEAGEDGLRPVKMNCPVVSEIWTKYQVAQISRLLSTLLTGGIPLVQGLETAAESIGSPLLRQALDKSRQMVREGQSLSSALRPRASFPPLSIDMIEVGESTGALPAMLSSVAEFYEDDVNTRMQAALSLIEPAIMIFMGGFVAFVLLALYLPIFSLADTFN